MAVSGLVKIEKDYCITGAEDLRAEMVEGKPREFVFDEIKSLEVLKKEATAASAASKSAGVAAFGPRLTANYVTALYRDASAAKLGRKALWALGAHTHARTIYETGKLAVDFIKA